MDWQRYASVVERHYIRKMRDLPAGSLRPVGKWHRMPRRPSFLYAAIGLTLLVWVYAVLMLYPMLSFPRDLAVMIALSVYWVVVLPFYRVIWPLLGIERTFDVDMEALLDRIVGSLPSDRCVVHRPKPETAVLDMDGGAMKVGFFGITRDPDLTIVHIHPTRQARRSTLSQVKALFEPPFSPSE